MDKETMLSLIIDAKRTDPETGSFAEWLAEYLTEKFPTLSPPNEPLTIEQLREMDGSRCGLWSNLTGGTGSYQQMRRIIWQTVTKIFTG